MRSRYPKEKKKNKLSFKGIVGKARKTTESEAHFDVVDMDHVPAVVQVLFQVFVLKHTHIYATLHPRHPQQSACLPASDVCAYLTRYSNTSVRDFCVWMMSWSVTMLACFRSFSRDTERDKTDTANTAADMEILT